VVFSISRQHGVPLETIVAALTKLGNGAPAGPLGIALKLSERPRLVVANESGTVDEIQPSLDPFTMPPEGDSGI
jgi:hypothetical protein